MSASRKPLEVVLEVAPKLAFASAVDWPGWCRSGKTPDDAVQTLADYGERYAVIAKLAKVRFSPSYADEVKVVDETPGSATTGFGAPGQAAATDARELTKAEADRQVRLLRASWKQLERLAVEAPPAMRKGPRGGGRDRDAIVEHVIEAERSYARKIGVRHPPFHGSTDAVAKFRAEVEQVLRSARSGEPMPAWSARYYLRRATWHVLDHVWEIEDKSS